jgi:hypothetical protein
MMLISSYLFLVAQVGAGTSTTAHLDLVLNLTPTVLDYELPGHVHMLGRGHVGLIAAGGFRYQPNRYVSLGAGIMGRAPFALERANYADAIGVFYVEGRPLGTKNLSMRFGSLNSEHGYHTAVSDEPRFAIARNIMETYNRSIVKEAHRDDLPRHAMPAEHGAQFIFEAQDFRADLFLDWQLLETSTHREKFNFGALGQYDSRWIDVGLQFRLTHYGGQIFTQGDPIRFAQLDPVRQPETFALVLKAHPLVLRNFTLNVLGTGVAGHMKQIPGGEEKWHYGIEAGLESILAEDILIAYRYWHPKGGRAGYVSEDSDPTYNQGVVHRIEVGLLQTMGGLKIDGRLAIMLPKDAPDKVQYMAITQISYDFLHRIF